MFHSQPLSYLYWPSTHYIHRLPCLTYSDYHQTNLFLNERAVVGCRGSNGFKINWSLRTIQLIFFFISFLFISSLFSLFTFIPYLLQFHFISFQCHFNFLSILFYLFIFLLYFTNYFFCTLLFYSFLYFTVFYLI